LTLSFVFPFVVPESRTSPSPLDFRSACELLGGLLVGGGGMEFDVGDMSIGSEEDIGAESFEGDVSIAIGFCSAADDRRSVENGDLGRDSVAAIAESICSDMKFAATEIMLCKEQPKVS
jgi:hypothetical protein